MSAQSFSSLIQLAAHLTLELKPFGTQIRPCISLDGTFLVKCCEMSAQSFSSLTCFASSSMTDSRSMLLAMAPYSGKGCGELCAHGLGHSPRIFNASYKVKIIRPSLAGVPSSTSRILEAVGHG